MRRRARRVTHAGGWPVSRGEGCLLPAAEPPPENSLTPPSLPPPGLGRSACETACPPPRVPVTGSRRVLTHVCSWTSRGEVGLPGRCSRRGRPDARSMAMTARTRPLPFPGEAMWPAPRQPAWGLELGAARVCVCPGPQGLGTLPSLSNQKGPGGGPSVTKDERETLVAMNTGSHRTNRPSLPFEGHRWPFFPFVDRFSAEQRAEGRRRGNAAPHSASLSRPSRSSLSLR